MRTYGKGKRVLSFALLLGFIAGILYANLALRQSITASGIFNEHFLNRYMETEIIAEDYVWYVIWARMIPFLAVCLLGCTKWKKLIVGCVLLWTGFSGGILTVAAVIRLGMKGIFLCFTGIFPQDIFYILAYVVLLWYLYRYPEGKWNTGKSVFVVLAFAVGILLEVYVNPILMKLVIRTF